MLKRFIESLNRVCRAGSCHPSLEDPKRKLSVESYLGLFLLGLVNPVIESMRGLCQASQLQRVQEEVCGGPVSLGSFSEMQQVLDPELLRKVLQDLLTDHLDQAKGDTQLVHLNLVAQDGSLWRALPRMAWAQYGVGPKGEAKGVRLHLRFRVEDSLPVDALVTRGKDCERQALRDMCVAGQTTVGDRYYGMDYRLFSEVALAQAFFVFRIKEDAVIHLLEEYPLSEEARAAGVVRHALVRLGAHEKQRSMPVGLVEIRTARHHLMLVTNLPVERASASLVGLIYQRRWSIELFFRWIKCILKSRHFFAESPAGAAIQLYLALIASLLFQAYTGQRPSKRIFELIQFYLMGWTSQEEFEQTLAQQLEREQARKKT
jgi:hypothetical protein